MKPVRVLMVLACGLLLALAFAQPARHADDRPEPPSAGVGDAAVDRLGNDAAAWLRRMLAAERAFAFAVAPEERSVWPAEPAAASAAFAWPAGVTLDAVRANFDVRWVGRERMSARAVVVIDLLPRHQGPAWRFWIDAATGARVAYRATVGDGRVVAEGRGDPSALVAADAILPLPAPRAPDEPRAELWRAAFAGLDGFEPVAVARVRLGAGVTALRVTLWDGLSGAVLIVYPAARTPARGDLIVSRTSGRLTLALVGPVPEAAASAYLDELAGRRWARAEFAALLRQWVPGEDDGGGP
jgi:hypothetical protein